MQVVIEWDEIEEIGWNLIKEFNSPMHHDLRKEHEDEVEEFLEAQIYERSEPLESADSEENEVDEVIEELGISEERACKILRSIHTGHGGGPPSKVEFWAEKIENGEIDESDIGYDFPWPNEDAEMAIRSTATIAKLRRRLDDGQ